jgi:preprotein translocase subunit SecE
MSTKVETSSKPTIVNTLLLAIATAMLISGVGGYYWFQDLAITPVRVVALILVTVVASLIAAQSDTGGAFFRFLKESDIERRKVIWPTHQETLQTAMMVIIVTILISLFLAAVDWGLGSAVRALVGG